MTIPKDLASLTELFRKLGAPHPEGWARSEIEEEFPQLLRFLFLREAWKRVLPDDDTTWIDSYIGVSERRKDDPYAGVGHALKRLRAAGVRDQDLTDLVRGMQAELLFGLCYLLDGHDASEPEVADVFWCMFQTDGNGKALRSFGALHESVLETDPTGREMRPKALADSKRMQRTRVMDKFVLPLWHRRVADARRYTQRMRRRLERIE